MKATAAQPALITASKLRADIYNILDQIIETGQPVEIERKGVKVKIVPPKTASKKAVMKKETMWDRLKTIEDADYWTGDPNDIFHIDWTEEWRKKWGIEESGE